MKLYFAPQTRAGRPRWLLEEIFSGDKLPDDFSLYLHAPTVTDPSLAPPGCGAYYVLSPVPHLGGSTDWKTIPTGMKPKPSGNGLALISIPIVSIAKQ